MEDFEHFIRRRRLQTDRRERWLLAAVYCWLISVFLGVILYLTR